MYWGSALLLIVLSTASPSPPPSSRKFRPTEWNTTVKLELHDKHGDARLYHTLLPHRHQDGARSAGRPSIVVLHGAFNNASVFSWSMLPFIEESLSKGYVLIYAEGMVSIADTTVPSLNASCTLPCEARDVHVAHQRPFEKTATALRLPRPPLFRPSQADPASTLPTHERTWNAGSCCGEAAVVGADDITYLRAVVKDAASKHGPVEFGTNLLDALLPNRIPHRMAAEAIQQRPFDAAACCALRLLLMCALLTGSSHSKARPKACLPHRRKQRWFDGASSSVRARPRGVSGCGFRRRVAGIQQRERLRHGLQSF